MSPQPTESLRLPTIEAPWTEEERLKAAKAAMLTKAESALELHIDEVAKIVARVFDVPWQTLSRYYIKLTD